MKAAIVLGLTVLLPTTALAGSPVWKDYARMDGAQLDVLFAAGTVWQPPVGVGRGHVLRVETAPCPRWRAASNNLIWKGKEFAADGGFTNLWLGFKAVTSRAEWGNSWLDGRPCLVLEYPADAAMFANARDELREIAPGVWLGRFYERCPCPRFKGYFVLEMDGCGCR